MTCERENSRHKLENIIISETFLTVGELRKIIADLEGFILGKSKNIVIDVRKTFWIERMLEKWKWLDTWKVMFNTALNISNI